jgi:O-antigen/teichoic acid export membrane protein
MRGRRIMRGVGANVFDKLVIAGVQLAMVPVLATQWGLTVYGAWLLLSTIPSFLGMSDFGFAAAAGNRMTMLASEGKRDAVVRTFQSAWIVILLSSTAMIALALMVVWAVPAGWLPVSAGFGERAARSTLSLLLTYGIVALQGGIFLAGFRCAGFYATGTVWAAMAILFESLALIAAVSLGARPEGAAAVLLTCRALSIVAQNVLLRRKVPWLVVGVRHARRDEARSLLAPAVAVMALPLGQAAFLQGSALALGIAVSEAAVPAFTATRTLSRIGLQMTQLVTHALMPEYSAAVARGDRQGQATMLLLVLATATIVAVPFALLLTIAGPWFVGVWTHGVIRPDRALMIVMALTVVLGGYWNPLSNLILAMNRHAGFSYPYAIMAVATMPLAYIFSKWFGATGAGLAIAALDVGMCIVIARLGRRLFVTRDDLWIAARRLAAQARTIAGR